MGKKINIRKRRFSSFLVYPAVAVMFFLGGCATQLPAASEIRADNSNTSMIERNSIAQKDDISEYQTEQLSAKISDVGQEEVLKEAQFTESEPRILFEPAKSDLIQVLGIDFTMLELGKSRLTVTTDKKVTYDLDRKGDKGLILRLHDTTIPSLLLREIDTTHFKTALDKVMPAFSSANKEVSIDMSLREMTPFHIKQAENGLSIDFDQTSVKPPDTKIIPLDLSEARTRTLSAPAAETAGTGGITGVSAVMEQKRTYKNRDKMDLKFINVDVTLILQMVKDVSKENIIWDPEIKGKTISMMLDAVPWDEALDLILESNDLSRRDIGDNIIYITTKAKNDKYLADKMSEARRLQQEQREAEDAKRKAEVETKEQAPLITEYLPADFAKADEIKDHIKVTERGTKTVDTRTNTIIITDTAESIEIAKKTLKQFDTPVKQIMIEARIVDATDKFRRDLGIRWNATSQEETGLGFDATLESATTGAKTGGGTMASHTNDNNDGGGNLVGGVFSSNAPGGWTNNIGIAFARLTSSGFGTLSLDASLALAESNGTAKTLSAPKVIAREGTSATIKSGDKIIIPATENVASTTLDATLSLSVTPTSVSFNDYITLEVEVTDDKAPSQTLVTTKAITTTLMVKSGETVVIGGIIKESDTDDIAGIPVLKDIPGLGWLFKAKTRQKTKTELLIFLTPTVLPLQVN
ncbi:MAG TPA: type IV pilus secretin PilQ [Desulfatiglandales bacterium]|nr:type IV pilus secretin PilQ [Desulfatiglandales bacterium]